MTSLTCLLHGEHPNKTFNIRLQSYEELSDLKLAIKNRKEQTFINTEDTEIVVWRVEISTTNEDDAKYKLLASQQADINIQEQLSGELLSKGGTLITAYWPQPQRGMIHVLVEPPRGK